jgi:heavy metal sensor kinase
VRLPIRLRMTAWYVALLALIIAAVGAFVVLRLRADLLGATDDRLRSAVTQIAIGYHAEGPPEARDVAGTVLSGDAALAQVLTPDGRVVVGFGAAPGRAPLLASEAIRRVLAGGRVVETRSLGARRRRFRLAAGATTRGRYRRVVVAGEPTAATDQSVSRLLDLLLLAVPCALAATALGGWWLARRALRPIGRMTTEADRIGTRDLAGRLPVPARSDEVARLAATLNTMLARIEAGVEEQRRLVADTSHELRTPLAAMRAELDVSLRADHLGPAARAVLTSTREEVARLSRTVDDLLTLALADRGMLDVRREPVDLAVLAAERLERLGPLAGSSGVTLAAGLDEAWADGDARWLSRAVSNLVDNAIKFSPRGGTVSVTTGRRDGEVLVTVVDEGPGIPPDAREAVFDRFHRLDASRTRATGGSGIGLSIVREIAAAHGGRVWTEPGPDGGSRFVLALPGSAPLQAPAASSARSAA